MRTWRHPRAVLATATLLLGAGLGLASASPPAGAAGPITAGRDRGPAPTAPQFTDALLATGRRGAAYADAVHADAFPPADYAVTAGTLPDGLLLDTVTGDVTGTPTTGGTSTLTITATNTEGSDSAVVVVGIDAAPSQFTDADVVPVLEGSAMVDAVAADGVPAPTYAVTDGTLPAGVSLDPLSGAVTGTPTGFGAFTFTVTATNRAGAFASPITLLVVPLDRGYRGIRPVRLVDTRSGSALAAGSTTVVAVAGPPVLDGASAVTLTLTAVGPEADGYLTAYPCGVPQPGTANLNYRRGSDTANSVSVPLGKDATVCVYTSAATQLLVDLDGAYSRTAGNGHPRYVTPVRVLDTRAGAFMGGGETHRLPLRGVAGVPDDATSVALNVTVVAPVDAGFLSVFPCGMPPPEASSVNYRTGRTVPAAVTSALGDDGAVCLWSSVNTHVVIDLYGYYAPGATRRPMLPLLATRLLDTRGGAKAAAGSVTAVEIGALPLVGAPVALAGRGDARRPTGRGVPVVAEAEAVELNVAATDAEADGFLTVFPCGASVPNASAVNYVSGISASNSVSVAVGAGAQVCIYTSVAAHLVVDWSGGQPMWSAPVAPVRADPRAR